MERKRKREVGVRGEGGVKEGDGRGEMEKGEGRVEGGRERQEGRWRREERGKLKNFHCCVILSTFDCRITKF